MDAHPPEISDVIVDFDPETLERLPVSRAAALARFADTSDRAARKVIDGIPTVDGVLDGEFVDRLLIRVHAEMQGLSEEFEHGRRAAELLGPMVTAARSTLADNATVRVVDVGCGTGYVIRWLAHSGLLGPGVELVGVDFNAALVAEAARLAALESLPCRFAVGNAFTLEDPATLFVSTGVIHHFRGAALRRFFVQHDQPATLGYAHFDFQPTPLARPGAWLFHQVRMREPLAHHDGVLSAVRAHQAATLLAAADDTGFATTMFSTHLGPFPRAFHTLLAIRPPLVDALEAALGRRARRIRSWSGRSGQSGQPGPSGQSGKPGPSGQSGKPGPSGQAGRR